MRRDHGRLDCFVHAAAHSPAPSAPLLRVSRKAWRRPANAVTSLRFFCRVPAHGLIASLQSPTPPAAAACPRRCCCLAPASTLGERACTCVFVRSVCLSVCLSVCPFVCLSLCPSVPLSFCFCLCLPPSLPRSLARSLPPSPPPPLPPPSLSHLTPLHPTHRPLPALRETSELRRAPGCDRSPGWTRRCQENKRSHVLR